MDYELELKVRNGRITQAMQRVGIASVAELVRRVGVSSGTIYGIINMRISPLNQNGGWRHEVLKMAEVLDCMPSSLFNEQQMLGEVETNHIQVFMSADQLACFLGQSPGPATAEEIDEVVDKRLILHRAMTCLSDREAKVLTLRLENIMYEDVAKLIGTTRERVRFVEAKAVEKVRAAVAQIRNGGSAC